MESKQDKNERRIILEYLVFPEEESTRNGARGGQEIGARLALSWATCKAVDALLLPQES